MKKFILFLLCLLAFNRLQASCPGGFSEIIVQIVPDQFNYETSWNITDNNGTMLASGLDSGDTICVPTGTCCIFSISDSFGDGIYLPGGYWLYVDGVLVSQGNAFGYGTQVPVGCAPGMYCSSSLPLTFGAYTAPFDNTWYIFTAPQTGTYNITTCGLNTCDTKIWVYAGCNGILNAETPAGTYAFNDNASCGLQAELNVVFLANQTYYIRIGDNMDDCPGTEAFTFSYVGPVQGCIDPTACNYNPLATVDDGSCIFYPNPGCTGPDLQLDSLEFINSMMQMTVTASGCDLTEGCLTGYGTRYVISFSSKINNIGTLDYYIGNPTANPTMFNTVNCHGHAHYEGYGDYRLYDMNGFLIPAGHKNGFCVMDLCGMGQYNCADMGISVGCFDEYGAGTQCQWIDITDVPDGDYRLAAIINSHHLPDGLGHYESNYVNNALQICINIHRNNGIPSYTILPNCTPFVDCMGIPGGAAMLDCNGICNGPGMYGNVYNDLFFDSLDVLYYVDMLEMNSSPATTCNDLNGDGQLTVYDAALANWCVHTPHHPHPAGSGFNPCNFPHNIVNPNDTVGLTISGVNFTSNYIDISIKSPTADIKAYQFSMHGITISNVMSLASPLDFPCDIRKLAGLNEVLALSMQDSNLTRNVSTQVLCRIYFSAITDTMICIENIREIINQNAERTNPYIFGGCVSTTPTSIAEAGTTLPILIFPNPATNAAIVQLPHDEKPVRAEAIDMTGRIISIPILGDLRNNYVTDLRNLKAGIYMIRIYTADKTGTVRLVKN